MHKKRLWVLFILLNFYVSAQTKGVVLDESGKPIPYVNIWVENENIGTTSEENGTFSIAVSDKKNLVFSLLGFEKKTIKASEANRVVLKEIAFELNEVVLLKRFQTKEREIGQIEDPILVAFDNGPRIDVKFFPYLPVYKKTKFLKAVTIFTDSRIDKATVKIHFYSVAENGYPGPELLTKDLIVNLKKGTVRNRFDVMDLNLKMPTSGLFVGFEKLIIEKNKLEKTITDSQTNTTHTQTIYYPFVLYNYVERPFLYTFSGGKWNRQTNVNSANPSEKASVNEPAINLVLTN